ncbi:hypothetical protein ALC62_06089 [Cyphomyrmex costatus]|uniref:Uncharacterized protein n=1 Tax=Cyphomyrmex costatus TaxID=456900 RepID=A0A195CQS4_9HYME|nr:hypothetical protein ALC62_06089 [Cyphomyrmex costatus]
MSPSALICCEGKQWWLCLAALVFRAWSLYDPYMERGKACKREGKHKGRSTSRRINRYVKGSTDTETEANECECSGKGNHVIEELRGEEARARYLGEAVT